MTWATYPNPPQWEFPVIRRPLVSLAVQTMASGKELLADFWLGKHKWEFSLTYPNLQPAEYEILVGFFLAQKGEPFLINPNGNDFGVVGASLGTGNGSQNTFQLVRPWGGYFNETCKYIHTQPNIYVGGVLQNPAYYTVNSSGQVVFASGHIPAVGQAVTADFSYDEVVRFAVEGKGGSSQAASGLAGMTFELFAVKLWKLQQVDLITWFE